MTRLSTDTLTASLSFKMPHLGSEDGELQAGKRISGRIHWGSLLRPNAFSQRTSQSEHWSKPRQTLGRCNPSTDTPCCSTCPYRLSPPLHRCRTWRTVACQYRSKSCRLSSVAWRVPKANRRWFHHPPKARESWWSRSGGPRAGGT